MAVLASLVFLFFQMRQMTEQVEQTERNQQALITQGVRTRGVEILLSRMEPSTADAVLKGLLGADDISSTQYQQFICLANAMLGHYADIFFQHKAGLITDAEFDGMCGAIEILLSAPGFRQYWAVTHDNLNYPKEFTEFIRELMAGNPVQTASTFEQ